MATCEVCGNDYDKSFEVVAACVTHTFDSFECAIHKMAPVCEHCGCKVIGHGVEVEERRLAQVTGESITEATRRALDERLQRERARAGAAASASTLHDIVARGRQRAVLDDRPADEVLGYDSAGLPT